MKRPYISISGTLDELILMEAILAYYYDFGAEDHNNAMMFETYHKAWFLVCHVSGTCMYFSHNGTGDPKRFKASQLTEILTYIEEYERS